MNKVTQTSHYSDSKILKVYFPSEIRRYKVKSTKYQDFLKLLTEEKKTSNFITQYLDDEEEWVTFSTSEEWNDALCQKSQIIRIRAINPDYKTPILSCSKQFNSTSDVIPNFFDFNIKSCK